MVDGTTPLNLPPAPTPKEIFDVKSPEEIRCEEKGGTWDEKTKTCKLPEPEPAPLKAPETFTDPRTGRAAGIVSPTGTGKYQIPDPARPGFSKPVSLEEYNIYKQEQGFAPSPEGATYLGLSPEDVQAVATGEAARVARPEGTAPVGTQAALMADMRRKIQLASQVGKIDFATASQLEEQGIDVSQAIAAGLHQAVPTALGYGVTTGGAVLAAGAIPAAATAGAAAPLAAGAAATAAAVGAGVGTIKGFYSGVTSNIKDQRKDLVTVKTKELKQRKTAVMNYISAANANPAEAEEYVQRMNIEFSLIRRDYNTLVERGNEDLNFWGSDATPQIVEYDVFFESVEPSLRLRMEQAVLKPDPARAYLTTEDLE